MPRRPFEAKLQALLASVPGMIEGVAEFAGFAKKEFAVLARHPRALGARLESQSSWLNRKFLSAASNVVEPFLLGMGLRIEVLGEEAVEVVLPGFWRNQTEGGVLHPGALATVGEFAGRIYWEHHLDLARSEISVSQINLKIQRDRADGSHAARRNDSRDDSRDVRAIFRMTVSEREGVLQRLRSAGSVEVDASTTIYDSEGRMLAEVDLVWRLRRNLALGSGSQADSGL